MGHHDETPCIYGTATVGTKGQIVIPAKAREQLKLNTGDTLLIMGFGGRMVVTPIDSMAPMLEEMTNRLETLRDIVDQHTTKKGDK